MSVCRSISGQYQESACPVCPPTWKVLPWPGVLLNPMLPCMSLTSARERLSPMPVPPNSRVMDESAWKNGSNNRDCTASGMPMPAVSYNHSAKDEDNVLLRPGCHLKTSCFLESSFIVHSTWNPTFDMPPTSSIHAMQKSSSWPN
jgi:hypothetical protein